MENATIKNMPGSAKLSGELVTNKLREVGAGGDPAFDVRCQGSSSGPISSLVLRGATAPATPDGFNLGGVYARHWHGGAVTVSWKVAALEGGGGGRDSL